MPGQQQGTTKWCQDCRQDLVHDARTVAMVPGQQPRVITWCQESRHELLHVDRKVTKCATRGDQSYEHKPGHHKRLPGVENNKTFDCFLVI